MRCRCQAVDEKDERHRGMVGKPRTNRATHDGWYRGLFPFVIAFSNLEASWEPLGASSGSLGGPPGGLLGFLETLQELL